MQAYKFQARRNWKYCNPLDWLFYQFNFQYIQIVKPVGLTQRRGQRGRQAESLGRRGRSNGGGEGQGREGSWDESCRLWLRVRHEEDGKAVVGSGKTHIGFGLDG